MRRPRASRAKYVHGEFAHWKEEDKPPGCVDFAVECMFGHWERELSASTKARYCRIFKQFLTCEQYRWIKAIEPKPVQKSRGRYKLKKTAARILLRIHKNRRILRGWNAVNLPRRQQWVAFLTPGVERLCYFKVCCCNVYVFPMNQPYTALLFHIVLWQLRLGRPLNSGIERACFQESLRAALPGCTGASLWWRRKKSGAHWASGVLGTGGRCGWKSFNNQGWGVQCKRRPLQEQWPPRGGSADRARQRTRREPPRKKNVKEKRKV